MPHRKKNPHRDRKMPSIKRMVIGSFNTEIIDPLWMLKSGILKYIRKKSVIIYSDVTS